MSFKEIPQETCLDTEYEFMGTVTISCLEYRDLIRTVAELKAIAVEEHDDYIDTRVALRDAKDKIKNLENEIEWYEDTVAEKNDYIKEITAQLNAFKAELTEVEE